MQLSAGEIFHGPQCAGVSLRREMQLPPRHRGPPGAERVGKSGILPNFRPANRKHFFMDNEIRQAVEVLRRGGIILYPTDTVWGIGCDATNASAVEKIYRLKRSENKKSMLVLVDSADSAARYVNRAPAVAWELMELSDKPLTLILPGGCGVASNLLPEEGTLGVRVPRHEFCLRLIRRLGRPLVSTSANISGEPAPACYGEIAEEILRGVDMAVNLSFEGEATHKPSSIIMLGEGGEVKIIR